MCICCAGCTGGSDERKDISSRAYINGEKVYVQYCEACHQSNGKGFRDLYPPLAQSDFLLTDLDRAACIAMNGINGEIQVNGKSYDMTMAPVKGMNPQKVTDVLNFIANSWGNNAGIITKKEVLNALSKCKEVND